MTNPTISSNDTPKKWPTPRKTKCKNKPHLWSAIKLAIRIWPFNRTVGYLCMRCFERRKQIPFSHSS